jgi:hypothetical protein
MSRTNGVGAEDDLSSPEGGFTIPESMRQIFQYENLIGEITRINKTNGPYYMQEFLKAINVASRFYTQSLWQYEDAIVQAKATRARLMIDMAPSAILAKGLRTNEENLKAYADSHEEYLKAKETENYLQALSEFLRQKVYKFERAHDDARKIFEAMKEPYGSAGALPSGRDT